MLETKEQKVMARKGFTKETKEEKPNGDFRNKKDKNLKKKKKDKN